MCDNIPDATHDTDTDVEIYNFAYKKRIIYNNIYAGSNK